MTLPNDLPIPVEQLFYADSAENPQRQPITQQIDHVHYPTLGCPALLGQGDRLQVLLSLPRRVEGRHVRVYLIERHRAPGESPLTHELSREDAPEFIIDGPNAARRLWRLHLRTDGLPHALFDLRVSFRGGNEVQYNAVRRYARITGDETVVFAGDSQFHLDNAVCLRRFVERVNLLDVAWVAIIGDICDNGVKSAFNILRLAARASLGPVTHYYDKEYSRAHKILRELRHPVILVPGNHDGMAAYENYGEGNQNHIYLGPDPDNVVEYDGLHHFRRTFGPLYFRFDWAGTRYLCTNTFELERHERLGYHSIVANWGGWIRKDQTAWIAGELAQASTQGLNKVLLMHHDPRGGSKSRRLGHYHHTRRYQHHAPWAIAKSYFAYLLSQGRTIGLQQEWMVRKDDPDTVTSVEHLLRMLIEQDTWAVIMGHDKEAWIDSYFHGGDLFAGGAVTSHRAAMTAEDTGRRLMDEAEVPPAPELVDELVRSLAAEDYAASVAALEERDPQERETALLVAVSRLGLDERLDLSSEGVVALTLDLPIAGDAVHFVHVDDISAYWHTFEWQLKQYGFALAKLSQGKPATVQRHSLTGTLGRLIALPESE